MIGATSGDTASAAIYCLRENDVFIIIMHPDHCISPSQGRYPPICRFQFWRNSILRNLLEEHFGFENLLIRQIDA